MTMCNNVNILPCQTFNYCIQRGIELGNVAPVEESCLQKIQEMVPFYLKSRSLPLKLLLNEIKEDHLLSIKAAICIYLITLKTYYILRSLNIV